MNAESNPIKSQDQTTRRRNKEKTVAALKFAARECLIAKGIAGLSVQPILTAAGVSRGALFHHFPTKNHLIAAAFSDLLEESAAQLHRFGRELRSGAISRGVFVAGVRDTFCSDLFIGSMEIALSNRVEPDLRKMVDDALDRWWQSLAAFWTDTFHLPDDVDAQQHWVMASNLLRGHAFTSTYRALPGSREAFCGSFEEMILARAQTREGSSDERRV